MTTPNSVSQDSLGKEAEPVAWLCCGSLFHSYGAIPSAMLPPVCEPVPLFARASLDSPRVEMAKEPRMAFCPACFVEVTAEQADQQTLDARRYRWLRDNPWPKELGSAIRLHCNASWDRLIDAAMAPSPTQEQQQEP